jgi:hypothetical protein
MTAYLRLLGVRTVRGVLPSRLLLTLTIVLPTLLLAAFQMSGGGEARGLPRGSELTEQFVALTGVVLLVAVLSTANLTAFFIHDERRSARSRVLRLATVDGWSPVAAYLCHASLLAMAGVVLALLAPSVHCLTQGMPPGVWPLLLYAAACATAGGALGLWLGYLLPRVVALVAIQLSCFWAAVSLAGALARASEAGAVPVGALGAVAGAHVLTLAVLPLVWRRTSGRLW